MKVFSEFGEVTQAKLMIDKESGQSLGFAYIWFVKEESAESAVKDMNGKFFDGRFIYVTTAKPISSRSWKRTTAYKF
ncbi:RNA-binding domain superfamily [Sesbania bispinosa]|nr:RNA-binding domain superfamily [Sesbania bispinosa]